MCAIAPARVVRYIQVWRETNGQRSGGAVTEDGVEFPWSTCTGSPAQSRSAPQLEELADGAPPGSAGDGQTPDNPNLIAIPDADVRAPLEAECDATGWRGLLPHHSAPPDRSRTEAGFEVKIGFELEYFLVRRTERRGIELADPLDTSSALLRHPGADPLVRLRRRRGSTRELAAGGCATDHEDANGQFEQNFAYADALTTCDRDGLLPLMVEAMAQERGLIATFMPKPFAHLTGNGAHFHIASAGRGGGTSSSRGGRQTLGPSA